MSGKYVYDFPRPAVTCDVVLFAVRQTDVYVVLIKRKNPPFENMWALPGGYVDIDEDLEDTALRELEEETGIKGVKLEQFYTFGKPGRDPRGRTITVVYTGISDADKLAPVAGSDARGVALFNIHNLPPLAFDHEEIIKLAIEKKLSQMKK